MTMPNRLLVGTALCLFMAVPTGARAEAGDRAEPSPSVSEFPLILAQAEDPGPEEGGSGAEDCPPGSASQEGGCVLLEEAAPAEEVPAEEMSPETEAPAPEAVAPEPEPAPAEEVVPEQPAEPAVEPEAQAPTPAEEEPAEAIPAEPEGEPAIEEQAEPQMEEQPPAEEPAIEGQTEEEAQPPMEEAQPEAEGEAQQPVGEETPADETGQEEPAQVEEEPAAPGTEASEDEAPADEAPIEEQAQPDADTSDAPAEQAEPADEAAPDAEQQAEPSDSGEAPPEDADAQTEETEGEQVREPTQEALPEDAAPVLDSQKGEGAEMPEDAAPEAAEEQPAQGEQPQEQTEETIAPESDEQAQQNVVDPERMREEIRALVQEEGQRIELGQTPEDQLVRRREIFRPRESARVIEQYNDNRRIVEINNQVFVENSDYDRIVHRGDQVYYEELRGDRVREVVEREDGTRIITVRNRYGDILRRVRVMPDGGEYVLAYVPDDRIDLVTRFEDPAADLPPLRLTIPVSEYILEAETAHDPDRYYTFLHQPPVEPVQRVYSLEEVQYSARVRDMVRRVDLDTIEFEFGSARIEDSEIRELEALATAIQRLLDENPAETFLIEGHTDAVGSENANLALSDRRAEAVAQALTNVFGIAPENLVTQGYGEQYLKVGTQEPVRENRRVAVRRITPLVSPVASRQ